MDINGYLLIYVYTRPIYIVADVRLQQQVDIEQYKALNGIYRIVVNKRPGYRFGDLITLALINSISRHKTGAFSTSIFCA